MISRALALSILLAGPSAVGPSPSETHAAGFMAIIPVEPDAIPGSRGEFVCISSALTKGEKLFLIGLRSGKSCLGTVKGPAVASIGGAPCTAVELQAGYSGGDVDVAVAHWKKADFRLLPRLTVPNEEQSRVTGAMDLPRLTKMALAQAGDFQPAGPIRLNQQPRSTTRIKGRVADFLITEWDMTVTEDGASYSRKGPVFVTTGQRSLAIGGICSGEPAAIQVDGDEYIVANWGCCDCGQRYKELYKIEGGDLRLVAKLGYAW